MLFVTSTKFHYFGAINKLKKRNIQLSLWAITLHKLKIMKKLICIFFIIGFSFSIYGQNYQRPGSENINISTLKWKKYSSNSFDVYYKPTGYFFNANQDFRYFTLQNGDIIIYSLIGKCYWQLDDFDDAPTEVELDMSVITCSKTVFIRSTNGGFWIKQNGKNVTDLQLIQFNPDGTAVYWSSDTGKKYWIPHDTYNYGSFYTLYPIVSE